MPPGGGPSVGEKLLCGTLWIKQEKILIERFEPIRLYMVEVEAYRMLLFFIVHLLIVRDITRALTTETKKTMRTSIKKTKTKNK